MYERLRKPIRKIILDILSLGSVPKAGIHILNGHFLSLDEKKSPNVFKDQMNMLLSRDVRFLDFKLAAECIQKREIPADVCQVAFTFDDGFEECFSKIRPILNKMGIRAGFFINPNFINGDQDYQRQFKDNIVKTNKQPMNWEQIRTMASEGHIIGAHTMDHVRLDIRDRDILDYQIGESKIHIEEKLGSVCNYFAFPFGRLEHISEESVEIALDRFQYIFSQSNYKRYFSFHGRVINRRHFECDWPFRHVLYFLKSKSFD